ncbi:Rhomboid family protein [Monaibacterium marinum]|uniref:Rhomboid family protein n=2 Tax=Pontivivens marinum TaxID=1690039 RepID=A0A2C9CUE3_9RHOB|nr:Rhomboid family protein [Monaibacterium marinum]
MRALWALTVLLLAIEGLLQLSDLGLTDITRRWAYTHGAFWRPLIFDEVQPAFDLQPYSMFITHAFLHSGIIHVVMNTVILLSIGRMVVMFCGELRMLVLFAVTAIAGGAGFALLGPDGLIPMVGASGAAFGFMAAWKRWEFTALRASGRPITPVLQFIGTMTVLNIALHFGLGGTLAWQAHLGGALAGWLIAPPLLRRARTAR